MEKIFYYAHWIFGYIGDGCEWMGNRFERLSEICYRQYRRGQDGVRS